jgi:hypothetical protein
MANNVTVTNRKNTFDGNANSDYDVRTVESVAVTGKQVQVFTSGFSIPDYDYVGVAYPTSTTETYTFKTGGSGGTTINIITLTYTDTTKSALSSAVKA